jgi:hypothetical protein
MPRAHTAVLLLILSAPAFSAVTDSDLISKALAAAKMDTTNLPDSKDRVLVHCRERAIDFTETPAVGRSNNLNEVKIERQPVYTVHFIHYGIAYDGYDCEVLVKLNDKLDTISVETVLLRQSSILGVDIIK